MRVEDRRWRGAARWSQGWEVLFMYGWSSPACCATSLPTAGCLGNGRDAMTRDFCGL